MSLLSGYAQLEYLESTGTQYINTLYTNSSPNKVGVHAKFIPTEVGASRVSYGNESPYSVAQVLNGNVYFGASGHYANWFTPVVNNEYEIETTYNKSVLTQKINGVDHSISYSGSLSLSYPMYIFAHNSSGTMNQPSKIKLKFLKLYVNDELVRDYIPAMRKSDNVVGLLDLCQMKFYGNSGTGTFVAGDEIGDIVVTDNPYEFTVGEDITLTANFKKIGGKKYIIGE